MAGIDQLEDSEVRRDAVLTPDHAFVWASAGTGKTHTLTLRALYLLLTPDQDALYRASSRRQRMGAARESISSVVMTTFTRKAAAEMQTRLFRYLDWIASSQSIESFRQEHLIRDDPLLLELLEKVLESRAGGSFLRLQQAARALAELASELQISTLHSFAASLLRRHPLEAGIPANVRFAREDEDDLSDLDQQIIQRWWQRRVFQDARLRQALKTVLTEIPLDDIHLWLKSCFARPWLARELEAISPPDPAVAKQIIAAVGGMAAGLEGARGNQLELVRQELRDHARAIGEGKPDGWLRLAKFLEGRKDYLFPNGSSEPPKAILTAIDKLDPSLRRYFQNFHDLSIPVVHLALSTCLRESFDEWRKVLRDFADWSGGAGVRELGLVGFDDMIRLAVRLLEEHEPVRRWERRRLRALLVDEFQDTDSWQLRLLQALLRADPASNHDVVAFFVGDLKQSIYRFRGADVSSIKAFHRNFEALSGGRRACRNFQLQTSFRSVAAVTRFVNQFFDSHLPLASAKEHLLPYRKEEAESPAWIVFAGDDSGGKLSAEEGRKIAARETVRIIQEHVASQGLENSYRDILVLTRTNRELESLLPFLHQAGIPVVAGGTRTFYRHLEVLDLLNLLIALYHPLDTVAVAAVLRGPIFLLSDDSIHRLLEQVPATRLFHGADRLPGFLLESARLRIESLRELALSRRKLPLSDWIRRVRRFIPTRAYLEGRDQEGRALLRLNRILESFQAETALGSNAPLLWLLKQRERAAQGDRWDSDLGEDVTVSDESIEAVRAMTIHKAKGLEAKLVIVYGWTSLLGALTDSVKAGNATLLDLTEEDGKSLRSFSLDWGPVRIRSSNLPRGLEVERENSLHETLRLAYVTATRARDRIIFLNYLSRRQKRFPRIAEFLNRCQEGEVPDWLHFEVRQAADIPSALRRKSPLRLDTQRYRQVWSERHQLLEAPEQPLLKSPTEAEEEERRPAAIDEDFSPTPSDAALIGILVHRYLELYLGEPSFDRERLERLWLSTPGQGADRVPLERAAGLLQRFFLGEQVDSRGLPLKVRVEKGRILGREVPVFVTLEGQAWYGIIDLILEERDSIRGIDFKTGRRADPLPESYGRQEKVYSQALRQAFPGREVGFEFWWLAQDEP